MAVKVVPTLDERIGMLDELLEEGEDRLSAGRLAEARGVRAKIDERLARGDQMVVAALCGGTGTGKSSLFNSLAGEPLAEVGARRPVTNAPQALAIGDPEASQAVLDWLGVRRRRLDQTGPLPEGLVLVDLPDTDSIDGTHRAIVDRFVQRVDVLLWIVDPLKYAQRSLHHDYLRQLAAHAEVVVVVLNRIDELSEPATAEVLGDLHRLLGRAGLGRARVLATSTRTGEGLGQLRALLMDETRRRRAIIERLAADVRTVAGSLSHEVTDAKGVDEPDAEPLVEALASAATVDAVASSAEETYRDDAYAASRSLVSWWFPALVASILRPWRGLRDLVTRRAQPRRSGRPPAAVAPLRAEHALVTIADAFAAGLPSRWRGRLVDVVARDPAALATEVRRAVDEVPVHPPRRRWWTPVRLLLTAVEAVVALGALWLVVLGLLTWLQLSLEAPRLVGEIPWPTAMLVGGLIVRVLLGVGRRSAVRTGAERHRDLVAGELREAVAEVAQERVIAPLRRERQAHDRLHELITTLGR